MFWDPSPEIRLKNMISINKIARELGLFKDNYKCSTLHTTTIDNEDEDEDTTNESDQAPIFTGNKAFVLKNDDKIVSTLWHP